MASSSSLNSVHFTHYVPSSTPVIHFYESIDASSSVIDLQQWSLLRVNGAAGAASAAENFVQADALLSSDAKTLKSGFIKSEEFALLKKLEYTRYIKAKASALYERIPFENYESFVVTGLSDEQQQHVARLFRGFAHKGQKCAVLESMDSDSWFHVVFDVADELQHRPISCEAAAPSPDALPMSKAGPIAGAAKHGVNCLCVYQSRIGYIESYVAAKCSQVDRSQFKLNTSQASAAAASSSAVHTPQTSSDSILLSPTAGDADSEATTTAEEDGTTATAAGAASAAAAPRHYRRPQKQAKVQKFDKLAKDIQSPWYDPEIQTYQFHFPSIGIFHSCFKEKNGTPRQGNLAPFSKGKLVITIPNAHYAVEGLEDYSHLWLVFVFHKNTAVSYQWDHPKVKPPRLDGEKVGVFSTRSPHRPNPIGLTCARIDRVENNTIYLSGVDLVDGTPVIDIKPYIPHYDSFGRSQINQRNNEEQAAAAAASTSSSSAAGPAFNLVDNDAVKMPQWIAEAPEDRIAADKIRFSDEALRSLEQLLPGMEYFHTMDEVKLAIVSIIRTDPRPMFMKGKKRNIQKLYGFRLDNINIRCTVQEDDSVVIGIIERWYE